MTVEDVFALASVVSFALSVYGFIRTGLAIGWSRAWKSLALLIIFFGYCLAGFGLVWWIADPPAPEGRAVVSTLLALLWIGYGGVWLVRLVPKQDEQQFLLPLRFPGRTDAGFALLGLAALICLATL